MDLYKKLNNLIGWAVFIFALVVYTMTIESSASFWDCGEFISGAYKLEVVHPPGAPFFLMLGRVFTLFAMGDVEMVAWWMNFFSGISSAFAVLFTFWSVTMLARKLMFKDGDYSTDRIIAVMGAGIVAGTACTFLDSFWFSAVEGEVYALSYMLMTFVLWVGLKWDSDDSIHADRWLLLIAIALGFATGVHLLSLLVVPVVGLIYYLKRWPNATPLGGIIALGVSFVFIGFVMKVVISGLPAFAAQFDRLFVNNFGMAFGVGASISMVALLVLAIYGIYYTHKNGYAEINKLMLSLMFLVIGYSAVLMVPIRSKANPPINMNKPQDPYSLLSYLNREQYGDRPLLFGPNYIADQYDIKEIDETEPKWAAVGDRYEVVGNKFKYVWKDEAKVFFPRMGFWQEKRHINAFRAWLNPDHNVYDRGTDRVVKTFNNGQLKAAQAYVEKLNADDGQPRYSIKDDVGMRENLGFFFQYQIGFMYMRYFLWNFVGRQNDTQGMYYNDDGRWLSGIPFIDNNISAFGGTKLPQENLPSHWEDNFARNHFYGLPLIIGLLGMIWQYKQDKENFSIVFFYFFVTGLLQVVYHNQPPIEPRERDYVFAGSFVAFSIWIGYGVLALWDIFKDKLKGPAAPGLAIAICLVAPAIMGFEGWDDHDRSPRYTARDFAVNYLESCAPNAILFTQGDNDTYPLWYAQEVENIRPDIRIINLSLLGVDWYIDQLHYKINEADAIKLSFEPEQTKAQNRDIVRYRQNERQFPKGEYHDLRRILKFIASEDVSNKVSSGGKEMENYLPSKNFYIPISKETIEEMDMLAEEDMDEATDGITWRLKGNSLLKNDLITLDIVANNIQDRPIYFAVSVSPSAYLGLDQYFQLEGLTYRVVPRKNPSGNPQYAPARADLMYTRMLEKFRWGNIDAPSTYLDENIMRMTMNLRGNFVRLAEALISKGEKEKAITILDHCMKVMPPNKVPMNVYVAGMPQVYYAAGAPEQGKATAQALVEKSQEILDYYISLPKGSVNGKNEDIQRSLYIMQQMLNLMKDNGEKEYQKELREAFDDYQNRLASVVRS